MFPDHVEPQVLEQLQVVHHRLPSRGRINAIRPEALVQGAKHENKLAIQQRAHDAVDGALGDGAEPDITLGLIAAQLDSHVVQIGGIGRPQLR